MKNLFNSMVAAFVLGFIYFVINHYISEVNIKKISKNRLNLQKTIEEKTIELSILKNNTNNIIEYNSGYSKTENKKKRNFWDLLKTK